MSHDTTPLPDRIGCEPDREPTLDHVTIESDGAPDECALFPREATEEELMDSWITAQDESFVDLESAR